MSTKINLEKNEQLVLIALVWMSGDVPYRDTWQSTISMLKYEPG
jgi:hypothetical protein